MAKEPKYTWANPRDPHNIGQFRVFGYYEKSDLTRSNVPNCGGRRYRLPSGEEITVTRLWCNANPKFDMLDMLMMGTMFVDNKPSSTSFVADLTNATLLATYHRPADADPFFQGSDVGWKPVARYSKSETVLEKIGAHLKFTDNNNNNNNVVDGGYGSDYGSDSDFWD